MKYDIVDLLISAEKVYGDLRKGREVDKPLDINLENKIQAPERAHAAARK